MAKEKVKENEIEQLEKDERKPGIFQKIFVLGVIPLLFIITILLIMSIFTNFNVFDKAKDVLSFLPFISSEEQSPVNNAEEIVNLQAKIKEKEAELNKLQADLDKATKDNEALLVEQERLQFEIDKLQRAQEQATKDFADIIATYEAMAPEKSAPVIVQMNEAEAVRVLAGLKPETLADVLASMPAGNAAKFTELMAKQ